MKDFFNPHDFATSLEYSDMCSWAEASALANEKLNALIESWPTVYKYSDSPNWMTNEKPMSEKDEIFFSFDQKARLAFIEEIVKEPCKHEVNELEKYRDYDGSIKNFCKHCKVEIVVTWSAK